MNREISAIRFTVIVVKADNGFGAYVPDLPGCVAVGETKEQVRHLIREAIELHLSSMKAEGIAVPDPTSSSDLVEIAAQWPTGPCRAQLADLWPIWRPGRGEVPPRLGLQPIRPPRQGAQPC